jgi:methionyl-tRNA formyltransferase
VTGEPLRLVFAGTPEFAAVALRALVEQTPHRLVAVYTQPDRPAGRGRQLQLSPVKKYSINQRLTIFQPPTLKNPEAIAELADLAPDLMIVAAYGLLLPAPVLRIPRLGCVNIHASLLPRWRGAAPIQRAILAGDAQTGITLMQMDEGLDTGPMLLQKSCPIGPQDTAASLTARLADLGAQCLLEALPALAQGTLPAMPQDPASAIYARKIDKSEGRLDWSQAAGTLERQIRAFNPQPGCYGSLKGQELKIWSASALTGHSSATPGEVLAASKQGIDVATGQGILRLTHVQAPSKRAMSAAEFVNGNPDFCASA